MAWVAAIGTVGTVAGKLVGGSGGSSPAAPAAALPSGDFTGGDGATGDLTVNKPAFTQTTIIVIIAAVVAIFYLWRVTTKK
jgi:hypothetical protein